MPLILGKLVIGGRRAKSARPAGNGDSQCRRPRGWMGRFVLRRMNVSHSRVTDWGLAHVPVKSGDIVLDVGCGGGRTVGKLAAIACEGKVHGVDFSEESVAMARKFNRQAMDAGQVDICEGSVSRLPFADGVFDVVTAVESHFWWPDLPRDLGEVFRALKRGGRFAVIAEVFKGANTALAARLVEDHLATTGLKLLTVEEHRDLLAGAGFEEIQISTNKSWICVTARRP